jgi:hypothetical protein
MDRRPDHLLVDGLARSGHAVALYDAGDRLAWANEAYSSRFLRHGLAEGATFEQVLRGGFEHGYGVKVDSGDIEAFLAVVLAGRRARPRREFPTDLVDGTWLWVHEDLLDNGWLWCTLTDITSLKRTEHALARAHADALEAARTDALTGADTRAWLMQRASAAHEACTKGGSRWPSC